MIAYSRPKRSDLYTLCWSKLLENHNLHSGTYPYGPPWAVGQLILAASAAALLGDQNICYWLFVHQPGNSCSLCGKRNSRFYCLENLHNSDKTFLLRFHWEKKHTKLFLQAGSKSPSFFSIFTPVGWESPVLAFLHVSFLHLSCPFWKSITKSALEIPPLSRCFSVLRDVCMMFAQFGGGEWELNLDHSLTVFKMAIVMQKNTLKLWALTWLKEQSSDITCWFNKCETKINRLKLPLVH